MFFDTLKFNGEKFQKNIKICLERNEANALCVVRFKNLFDKSDSE